MAFLGCPYLTKWYGERQLLAMNAVQGAPGWSQGHPDSKWRVPYVKEDREHRHPRRPPVRPRRSHRPGQERSQDESRVREDDEHEVGRRHLQVRQEVSTTLSRRVFGPA